MNTPGLPPIISRTLAAFALGERKVQVVRGLGESLIVYLGGLGAVALIDATLKPGHGWHWALSLTVYGLTGAVVVARVVLPFIRKPSEAEIAHAIESRIDDKLEEQLSSAVELAARSDPGVSAWMVERTVALGAQQVADLDVPALIDREPAQRAWKRAGVVLAAIAAVCIVPGAASYLARAALPALLRPAQVTISVMPGDQHLALGAALEVVITASPDPGAARLALAWDDGVEEAVEFTSQGDGRYTTRLPAVTNALRYRVTAGDGESASYRVTVSRPPVLGDLALRVTPPLYSGLPPRDITGGDAEVLAGSTVTLTAKLDGAPAVGGALVFDGGEQAATLADGTLSVVLKPTATIAYGLRLIGDGGLIAQPAQRWILSVRPDVPPVAQLTAAGLEGGLVGDDEALLMSAALRDDLGLRSAELVVLVDGNERQVRPLPLPGDTKTEATVPVPLDLGALKAKEGEELTLAVRATDLGGQRSMSEPVTVVVTSVADARGAAQAKRLRAALTQVDAQYEALRTLVRTWGQIARQDDAGARSGELALMANRILVWRDALTEVSGSLVEEATDGAVATARPLMNLAGEFGGWSRGASSMLEIACTDGRADAKILGRGRDLGDAALNDLESLRHDLALIIARLESGGLAAGADAAHARYQRAAPIVRGDRGWRGSDGWRSGLLGEFRPGQDFGAPVKYREIALPVWRNRDVPGLGRDNFCVRYRGEINIPTRGEWEFAAGADDGIRLRVAGRTLTPDSAWTSQAYTEYRGKMLLEAGWHPIEVEGFQGGGDSGIGLSFAEAGKPLRQVRESDVRCLPSRGAAGWKPGLVAQFRPGKDFNAQVKFQEVGNPNWKDREIPGLGRENFCVRWQGEIRIPLDGEWDITVGGNDGVRARIAGQDATPGESFESHSYKEFKRTLRLAAGWHTIELDLYQLGGNNGIGLAIAPKGQQPKPVSDADLRCRDGNGQPMEAANDPDLVRAMASLPGSQVQAAQERLRAALTLIAQVPKRIGDVGTLAANEELSRVARERDDDGKALAAALPTLANWDLTALAEADRRGETLAKVAAHARNVINNQVDRELRDRVDPGELAALRQAIHRIKDRARALRESPDRLPERDRKARWAVETSAGRAWVIFIGDEAAAVRRVYLDTARRSGASLATRSSALHAARRMDMLGVRVEEALAALRDLPSEQHPAADRLNQQADRLAEIVNQAEHWERTNDLHQLGERAAPLVTELRLLEPLRRDDPEMARGRWELAVTATRLLTKRARMGRHAEKAEQIDKLLAKWSDDVRPNELADRLNEFAQHNDGWHDGLDRLTAEQLADSAKRLGQSPTDVVVLENTVLDLDEARLAEAVEGERRFTQNRDPLSKAFIALAADIGVVVDTPVTPTPALVQAFAERAFALINQRGEDAKKQEIAKAEQRETADPEKNAESKQLDALAEQLAKAADKKEERDAALAKLEELAKDAERAEQAEQEAELAKELQELLRQQNALAAEELAARRAFAETEKKLAQQLPAIAEQAKKAAEKTTGELAKALAKASEDTPQAAKDITALADDALAKSPESAPAAQDAQAANDPQQPSDAAPDAQAQNSPQQPGEQPPAQNPQQPQDAQAQNSPQDNARQPSPAQPAQPGEQANQPQAPNGQQPATPEPAASTAELVARANAAADKLEQDIAQPLAEQFQQATQSGDPTAQAAADVGRQVAEAAAAQRAAAERLAQVLEQQAENREDLASALQQASALEQAADGTSPEDSEKQSAAEKKAEKAQEQADKAQASADKAQASADKALAQAQEAAANARQADGDAQAQQQAQQQAAQAATNAANAQQEAVAAQERALDAQTAALEAAAASGASDEHLAEAVDNLAQAERNSLDALDNSTPTANASAQDQTSAQAGENLERAAKALAALSAATNKAAADAAQELASNAAEAAAEAAAAAAANGEGQAKGEGKGEPSAQASAPAPGQGEGKGEGQGEGKGEGEGQGEPSAASQAAANALAAMQAGGDQRNALQAASKAMAAAAQQARLASSTGKGKGQGQPGQGENQGKAQSTGDAGSAAGMRRAPPGIDQADWARAQEKKRTDVGTVSIERFSEEHQEAIRAYLRRLGEGK